MSVPSVLPSAKRKETRSAPFSFFFRSPQFPRVSFLILFSLLPTFSFFTTLLRHLHRLVCSLSASQALQPLNDPLPTAAAKSSCPIFPFYDSALPFLSICSDFPCSPSTILSPLQQQRPRESCTATRSFICTFVLLHFERFSRRIFEIVTSSSSFPNSLIQTRKGK